MITPTTRCRRGPRARLGESGKVSKCDSRARSNNPWLPRNARRHTLQSQGAGRALDSTKTTGSTKTHTAKSPGRHRTHQRFPGPTAGPGRERVLGNAPLVGQRWARFDGCAGKRAFGRAAQGTFRPLCRETHRRFSPAAVEFPPSRGQSTLLRPRRSVLRTCRRPAGRICARQHGCRAGRDREP